MEEYKINMTYLKAQLFDDIINIYHKNPDNIPRNVGRAAATIENIKRYGIVQKDGPFIEDGENNG